LLSLKHKDITSFLHLIIQKIKIFSVIQRIIFIKLNNIKMLISKQGKFASTFLILRIIRGDPFLPDLVTPQLILFQR